MFFLENWFQHSTLDLDGIPPVLSQTTCTFGGIHGPSSSSLRQFDFPSHHLKALHLTTSLDVRPSRKPTPCSPAPATVSITIRSRHFLLSTVQQQRPSPTRPSLNTNHVLPPPTLTTPSLPLPIALPPPPCTYTASEPTPPSKPTPSPPPTLHVPVAHPLIFFHAHHHANSPQTRGSITN